LEILPHRIFFCIGSRQCFIVLKLFCLCCLLNCACVYIQAALMPNKMYMF
uniref:Uncharacterized protein n=1 Tax=Ciona intestinalis TaxID=7719 RepID=H2XTT6_CIOIN